MKQAPNAISERLRPCKMNIKDFADLCEFLKLESEGPIDINVGRDQYETFVEFHDRWRGQMLSDVAFHIGKPYGTVSFRQNETHIYFGQDDIKSQGMVRALNNILQPRQVRKNILINSMVATNGFGAVVSLTAFTLLSGINFSEKWKIAYLVFTFAVCIVLLLFLSDIGVERADLTAAPPPTIKTKFFRENRNQLLILLITNLLTFAVSLAVSEVHDVWHPFAQEKQK